MSARIRQSIGAGKRVRSQTEEDDDEEETYLNGDPGPSNSRRDPSKRPRLSYDPTAEDDDDEEDEDNPMSESAEEDDGQFNNYRPDPDEQIEDYEDRRDAGFEDLNFQEADDHRATQIVQARMQEQRNNQAAENAIIEEIKCQNFMCHSLLTVKVGPLINFVIGHNGSGKSAVLTALTLCLGGKATATNRGQSLKSFIKEGEEAAMLSVKIKNQGSSAYKPELYGPSIIVERHFSKSGSSGFKIKNAMGKIISTKKQDLEDITDAFALQLDNPMNVLTQDMARQFLNHSTPSDKYKFFIKGTQLEQLDHDYRMLEENLERMDVHLQHEQDKLDVHKSKYRQAENKWKQSERQTTLKDRYQHFARQYVWMQVVENEKHIETLQAQVRQAEEKIRDKTAIAEQASANFEQAENDLTTAQATINELQRSREPIEEQLQQAKARFSAKKDSLVTAKSEQRQISSAISAADQSIRSIQKSIEEERRKQETADGGAHAQKLAEIQNAKAQLRDAEQAMEDHKAAFSELQNQNTESIRAQESAGTVRQAKRNEVQRQEETITAISGKQGDWARGYSPSLQKLLRLIGEERRFKEPPVGPFGRYIRLKDPEWSSVLESNFGGVLNSFAVSCKEDQELLTALARKANYNGPVYIGSAVPIDTSANEPDPNVNTILRALEIDNPRIRNQLIINNAIDQTVLIKDREEANKFMFDSGVPRNVKLCLALSEVSRKKGHSLRYSNSGGQIIGPVAEYRGAPRMQSDSASQLNIEKDHLSRLQRELAEAESSLRQKTASAQRCKRALAHYKDESRNLLVAKQRAEELVDSLQAELEEATPQAGMLEQLEVQLAQAEEDKRIPAEAFREAVVAIDGLNAEMRSLKKDVDDLQKEIEEVDGRILKAEHSLERIQTKRDNLLQQKNLAFIHVRDAEAEKANVEREVRDQQEHLETELLPGAVKYCERVPIERGETKESLEAKMGKLQRDLQTAEKELGGTADELKAACLEAKSNLERAKRDFRKAEMTTQALKNSMIDRQDRWKKFRRFISSRARILFSYLLSERDFRGTLIIDPAQKVLDIKVEPDITKTSAKGRQTKTLSGGEKSFSTICLLLSLWDAMGSPIRCLDEFDVFMDNVNRDISMRMMIGAARRSVSRQFILITPQAMGSVAMQDDVKIIKMGDPERGQTTLPYNRR